MKLTPLVVALSNALKRPDKPENYYSLTNSAGRNIINITGFIGWWDDEAIWLKNYLRDHEGEDIEIFISSEGGDVFTGQSMFNALKAHKGKTTCYIEKAFSIATHIAMACTERKIVKGSQMMIHAVSGWCGGTEQDHRAYAELITNAKDAIAESYVAVTGHDKNYWLDIMATDAGKYFTANECVELGLADEIVDPADMTNSVTNSNVDDIEITEEEEVTPPPPPVTNGTEEKELPAEIDSDDEGEDEMKKTAAELELERQKAVRNMFNSMQVRLNLPQRLLNEALDDETCDVQKAMTNFMAYTGEENPPESRPVNFGASHHAGSSDAAEMAVNVLLNRAGHANIENDFRSMQGASLENIVRSFDGMSRHGYGTDLYNAMLENEDIATALGTALDKVVVAEVTASENRSLALQFCKEVKKNRIEKYEVHNWNEVDGFGERAGGTETGAFPNVDFAGNAKREGEIKERGSKIAVTRKAFINDEWGRITALSGEHVKSAYRFADHLFIQRLMALAAKGHITNADAQKLMQQMSLKLRTAVTSNGDDLNYVGGKLLARPQSNDTFKPLCGTRTIEADVINVAYGAFNGFHDVNKLQDLVVGFADGETPMELAVLTGKERPHLVENGTIDRANGLGWTLIWDFDIQVSNEKAIATGSFAPLSIVQDEKTKIFTFADVKQAKLEAKPEVAE